jgi:hypothetical protein
MLATGSLEVALLLCSCVVVALPSDLSDSQHWKLEASFSKSGRGMSGATSGSPCRAGSRHASLSHASWEVLALEGATSPQGSCVGGSSKPAPTKRGREGSWGGAGERGGKCIAQRADLWEWGTGRAHSLSDAPRGRVLRLAGGYKIGGEKRGERTNSLRIPSNREWKAMNDEWCFPGP